MDERKAAEAVINRLTNVNIIGDKEFLGVEWQAQIQEQTGNTIHTPKRKNQKKTASERFSTSLESCARTYRRGVS
jgi:hypothetical protein